METYQCKRYGHTSYRVNTLGRKYCIACFTAPHGQCSVTFGEAVCPEDGVEFTKNRPNHVYCDIICQETFNHRRQRAKQKQAKLILSRG